MKAEQPILEAGKQRKGSQLLLIFRPTDKDRFSSLKIDITQLIQPEVMEAAYYLSQGILLKASIDLRDHGVETTEDPAVEEVLLGGVELTGEVLDEVEFGF